MLRASDRADFQANGALALAKRLGRNPREVADEVVAAAELDDLCEQVEVSGPGFINLTLAAGVHRRASWPAVAADARLGVAAGPSPETVVVDYSAPNVAKEMHVGHLRVDHHRRRAVPDARTLAGHDVRRENHIGDWGTPFGMLIEHLVDLGEEEAAHELSVGDLDAFYQQARASFDADEAFRERSRRRVVLLQSGDQETLRLWRVLVAESVRYFDEVYAKLGVLLTDDDIVGESFYNPMLADVVDDLDAPGPPGGETTGPAVSSRRASPTATATRSRSSCRSPTAATATPPPTWPPSATGSTGSGPPASSTWWARPRPSTSRCASPWPPWPAGCPRGPTAEHVAFGSVLGADRKMFKTRSGDSVKLVELLDEAVDRAGGGHGRAERRPGRARAGRRWPGRSASAPSSTPTSPPTGSGTTSSTGTGCWPSRATPGPTSSTPTPGSAPSSGAAEVARAGPSACRRP